MTPCKVLKKIGRDIGPFTVVDCTTERLQGRRSDQDFWWYNPSKPEYRKKAHTILCDDGNVSIAMTWGDNPHEVEIAFPSVYRNSDNHKIYEVEWLTVTSETSKDELKRLLATCNVRLKTIREGGMATP